MKRTAMNNNLTFLLKNLRRSVCLKDYYSSEDYSYSICPLVISKRIKTTWNCGKEAKPNISIRKLAECQQP